MNLARYVIAALVLFVFYFFYDWVVHGYLLMGIYEETPKLWRSPAEMVANLPLALLIKLVLAAWVAFAFTQIYEEGGVYNGFLFGIFFGVFAAILAASPYIWLPISAHLGVYWFVARLIEGVIAGLIVGAIYRNSGEVQNV